MKYTHDDIVWHIAPSVRPCPACSTLVHTLSAWDDDLGPLCPSCHPEWQYAPFIGQRPEDMALAQWKQKLKDRKEQLLAERRQAAQEDTDNR